MFPWLRPSDLFLSPLTPAPLGQPAGIPPTRPPEPPRDPSDCCGSCDSFANEQKKCSRRTARDQSRDCCGCCDCCSFSLSAGAGRTFSEGDKVLLGLDGAGDAREALGAKQGHPAHSKNCSQRNHWTPRALLCAVVLPPSTANMWSTHLLAPPLPWHLD